MRDRQSIVKIDERKIDDAVLALLYLTLDRDGRAWKGFCSGAKLLSTRQRHSGAYLGTSVAGKSRQPGLTITSGRVAPITDLRADTKS